MLSRVVSEIQKFCPACGKTHGEKDGLYRGIVTAIAEYNERTRLAVFGYMGKRIVEMLEELSSDRIYVGQFENQREVNGEMQVIPQTETDTAKAEARRLTRYAHMVKSITVNETAALSEFATERERESHMRLTTLGSFFDSTEKWIEDVNASTQVDPSSVFEYHDVRVEFGRSRGTERPVISIAEQREYIAAHCIRFGSGLFSDLQKQLWARQLMCGEDGCTQQEDVKLNIARYWLVILGPLQAKWPSGIPWTIDCAGNDLRTVLLDTIDLADSGVYMRHMVEFALQFVTEATLTLETATIGMQTYGLMLSSSGIYVGFRAPHERDLCDFDMRAALRRVRKSGIPNMVWLPATPDGKASGAIAPRDNMHTGALPAFAGALDRGDTAWEQRVMLVYDDIYRALNMTPPRLQDGVNIKRSPKDGRLLFESPEQQQLIGLKQDPNIIADSLQKFLGAETAEMGEDEADRILTQSKMAPKVPEQQQVREIDFGNTHLPKAPEAVAPAQPAVKEMEDAIHHTPEPVVEKAPAVEPAPQPEPAPVQPVAQTFSEQVHEHQHYHQPEPKLERPTFVEEALMAIKQANPDFSFARAEEVYHTQQEMILPTVPDDANPDAIIQRPGNARRPNPDQPAPVAAASITTTL
ncbi:hypothetical protein SPFM7_00251 [Salmonella phage SPFM7]|nr:hypothetical protein SPFM7_00251 [Salmonella phage SPFM7]